MKIIAYNNSKGICSLVYGAHKEMERLGMKEEEFLEHVREKNKIKDIPYLYVTKEDLPDKKYRNAWKVDHENQKIVIDKQKKVDMDARFLAEEEMIQRKKTELDSLIENKKRELLEKN